MKRNTITIGFVTAVTILSGCSTKLTVDAIPTAKPEEGARLQIKDQPWAGSPDGIVVNRLATYSVSIKANENLASLGNVPERCCISVIDPHHVLQINYDRMPFANGKLTLEQPDRTMLAIESAFDRCTDSDRNLTNGAPSSHGRDESPAGRLTTGDIHIGFNDSSHIGDV